MNETSATSASGLSLLPDGIATLTAIHFTIIAVVAILVILGLLWGVKAKRQRRQASREVIANAEEAGVSPAIPSEPKPAPSRAPSLGSAPAPAKAAREMPRASQFQAQTGEPIRATQPQSEARPQPQAEFTPTVRTAPISDTLDADGSAAPDPMADEPIAAAAPMEASPATEIAPPTPVEPAPTLAPAPAPAAPESVQPTQGYADAPVTQLKGLGPKVAAQLGTLGIATVGEMAALSDSEAQRIDAQLGNFTGRMGRDRWIEQARLLAAGDKAGFEAVFGKL